MTSAGSGGPQHGRPIPLGARVGSWVGTFGWLIGFAVVTLPERHRFAHELAGGFLATLPLALFMDWNVRRAPVLPLALAGVLLVTMAAIGTYWDVVCEPAVLASPVTFARLRWLNTLGEAGAGSITHLPAGMLRLEMGVGLVLLFGGWLWSPSER